MLDFDIDVRELFAVMDELDPTERQIQLAFSRAMNRTAATLRRRSTSGLRALLDLRTVGLLRQRLKSLKIKKNGLDGLRLWYGINPMPVSWFKGTPKAVGKRGRKKGESVTYRGEVFENSFVANSKVKGRKTIFKRKTNARLPLEEQQMPIRDKAEVFVEDEVFSEIEDVFWPYFVRDLRARVTFKIGER